MEMLNIWKSRTIRNVANTNEVPEDLLIIACLLLKDLLKTFLRRRVVN
jgi:hypothetical protein